MDTRFEPPKVDRLQSNLSSSWASYLSAQHSSREAAALKRHIDGQVKQINACVAALQQDLNSHQRLAVATAAESKAVSDQVRADLDQLKPSRESLPALQQDITSTREQASAAISSLREDFMALQERLDKMNTNISTDVGTVQAQYASALEAIEFLQGEIKELRVEKQQSEDKLAALERQVETMASAPPQVPQEAVELLGQRLTQKDEAVELLDTPTSSAVMAVAAQSGKNPLLPSDLPI